MAVKCPKCGGYIPDVSYGSKTDRNDCNNHIKPVPDAWKHVIHGVRDIK